MNKVRKRKVRRSFAFSHEISQQNCALPEKSENPFLKPIVSNNEKIMEFSTSIYAYKIVLR